MHQNIDFETWYRSVARQVQIRIGADFNDESLSQRMYNSGVSLCDATDDIVDNWRVEIHSEHDWE